MSSDGSFSVPPPFTTPGDYSDMPFYGIGSTVKLQWTLPEEDYNSILYLGKDGDTLSCPELNLAAIACTKLLWGNQGQSWDWLVQQPNNYNESSPVYYLMMRDGSGSHRNLFTSHYFNILPQDLLAASSTTLASTSLSTTLLASSSIASTTATIVGSPAATISTTATTSVTKIEAAKASTYTTGTSTFSAATSATVSTVAPGTTVAPAASSQTAAPALDSTTKLVIGVALGVGIPLIAALAAIAFFLYKGHKRRTVRLVSSQGAGRLESSAEKAPPVYFHHDPSELETTKIHYSSSTQPFQEMSGDSRPHQLHGTPVELYSAR